MFIMSAKFTANTCLNQFADIDKIGEHTSNTEIYDVIRFCAFPEDLMQAFISRAF